MPTNARCVSPPIDVGLLAAASPPVSAPGELPESGGKRRLEGQEGLDGRERLEGKSRRKLGVKGLRAKVEPAAPKLAVKTMRAKAGGIAMSGTSRSTTARCTAF